MEDNYQPDYEATGSVELTDANERVRQLREAYLEGRLKVDSVRVAEKLMAFERAIEPVFSVPIRK